jgi:5'-nucleotidase
MSNILIMNDDGPDATGLKVLVEAVKKTWGLTPTVMVPETAYTGASFSCSPGWASWKDAPAKEISPQFFTLPLTPVDILYRAVMDRESFSGRPWDLVLVGVNHGLNLGFDIYHSSTVSVAMTAASHFRIGAVAFSQQIPNIETLAKTAELPPHLFEASEKVIPDFLRKNLVMPGECWNVNFPPVASKGYQQAKVAHYSFYRTPSVNIVPRARDEKSDIAALAEGFVSVSPLELRVDPPFRY